MLAFKKATAIAAKTVVLSISYLLVDGARPHLLQSSSDIWIYSLVATDYDGYRLLPHFMAHYNSLGVPFSNFYLDVQHDPKEDNLGLRVITRRVVELHSLQDTIQENLRA